VAEAIHQGLEMSRNERRSRMQRMRQYVAEHNIYRWATSILSDLHELRMEAPVGTDVAHIRQVSSAPVDAQRRKLA
jgi:trehalose-6-phosphate synthase